MLTEKKKSIIEEVKNFMIDNFIFDEESADIKEDESFMDSGIIDSTGILELIDFLESQYSIELDDDEIIPENLDSLGNISNFILLKQG